MNIPESSSASADGVAAVDRALAIVKVLTQHAEPVSLAEISRATGYYKSTLLRLLASLERAALVVRRGDGRYGLGPFAHQLGSAYEVSNRLSDVLLPILRSLVESGTESASFHVRRDAETRQCVLRVDSHHSTLDRIRVGSVLSLDRGAAGKLLAAHYYGSLHADRGRIFASLGETDPLCAAIACPVFGPAGDVSGAISLSGPIERFDEASVARMSKLLLPAAQEATRQLGGAWPIDQAAA